jgi:hypothetical protein
MGINVRMLVIARGAVPLSTSLALFTAMSLIVVIAASVRRAAQMHVKISFRIKFWISNFPYPA